jgi:phosphoglycerate dehydrogenase-like enzyme
MKICILDAGQFVEKPELLDPLKPFGEITIYSGMPDSAEEVARRAGDAEVVAFAVTQLTREMVDAMPKLKVLQFIGTGMWNFVDVDYAQSKGIKVLNIEAYGSNAVAEFAVCLTAALVRNVVPAVNIIKSGGWETDGLGGREIAGSTVGVIGTGAIGRLVVEKFIGLGAHVIANDIFESDYLKEKYGIEYVSLEEIFQRSDIISLHMKVTKENEKLIDRKYLSLMKKNALLINVARAELVNIEDLYDALSGGHIGGAAIDVFTSEPPGELEQKLTALPNVIGTPHIGFYTEQSNDNSIRMSAASIVKALEG